MSFATATKHRRGVYSVRTDKYKLIYDQMTDSATLYDLRADPDEYHDRAATEPEVAHNMLVLLRRHLEADARAPMLSTETVPVDERLHKALESLGYLER